ncbi:MAG TPA: Na+/H+ antiporter NhaC family protein [Solirubrobacteraceae bacterium]|nr:Na+/H+ antiporter NhaC family protein [Solirubrobacteraceae bacterium]
MSNENTPHVVKAAAPAGATAPPQVPAVKPAAPSDGAPPPEPPVEKKKKTKSFPSALTVLAVVAVGVWLIALVVPSGEYRLNSKEAPIPHTYHHVHSGLSFGGRTRELILSPVNGLYGIKEAKTHHVAPGGEAEGTLYGSAEVFFFVLAVGAFIAVMFATGALDRGIGRLAYRTRKKGWLLIASIMVVFSLLGSVEGFAEETLAFYGLLIPLLLALGYDRMVAVGTIIVGAGVGVMGATVNPFSVGIASKFANVSIGDGLPLRFVMWIVLTAIAIAYVLRYAAKVKAKPETSLVGFLPGDRELAVHEATTEPPKLRGKDKLVLWGVGLTFGFMIFAVVPWAEIFSGSGAEPYSWQLDWWFPQLAMLFVIAAIVIGVLAGLREKELSGSITKGASEFLYPALVIVLARGVSVIMNNTKITATVLHAMEHAASGASKGVFAVLIFIINLPIAFLIPSTSGHATLAMPILAPLSDFAHVSGALTVTAWNAASGWMNLWIPTTAVVMGGVALAKVGYDKYLKWLWPLLAIYFVVISAFLGLAAALE